MTALKQFIVTILVIAMALPAIALAATPPALPLLVYGTVTIDGAPAPVGTVVKAENAGVVKAQVAVATAGKYYLEVPAVNAGLVLTYKVGGLTAAEEVCPNPLTTPSDRVNLAVVNPTSSSSGNNTANGLTSGTTSSGSDTSNGSTTTTTTTTNTTTPTVPAAPTTPTSPTPQVLGEKISAAQAQLNQILIDATAVYSENIENILANASSGRDAKKEKNTLDKYIKELTKAIKNLTATDNNRLNFFITYGTVGTKILGAGERAGVLNSYKAAFGKLPKTETEWQDAIKIAGGRWPSERNAAAETKAKASFKKIYGREANMENQNDNAAVTVMAYGLRPANRNLNSEKAAILAFKYFLKRTPTTAVDWDIVRAIAYSGAKR